MRKKAKFCLFLLLLSVLPFSFVLAGPFEEGLENLWQEVKIESQEKEPLLPSHPLYFFKTWKEEINFFLTTSPEKKMEKILQAAEERLKEIEILTEKGEEEKKISVALTRYKTLIRKAERESQKMKLKKDELSEPFLKIIKTYFKQQLDLSRLYEKSSAAIKETINHVLEQNRDQWEKFLYSALEKKEKAQNQWRVLRDKFEEKLRDDLQTINGREGCSCSNISHPVCGQDGKIYRNECFLRCAGVENDETKKCFNLEI